MMTACMPALSFLSCLGHRFYEHRRSSVVLNLPGLEVFPGDLLVSAGAADYLCHPLLLLNSGPVHSAYIYYMPATSNSMHVI